MNIKSYVSGAALATLLVAGVAAAQTTSTSTISLGNLTVIASPLGAPALSVPVTFSASSGGSLSNLSNCYLINAAGTTVSNTSTPAASNPIIFVFSPMLYGTNTLSLRCDMAAGTASGAIFAANAGAVTYGVAPGTGTGTPTTPGVPSTGVGGVAKTIALLAAAAGLAAVSTYYLRRTLA